MSEEKSILDAIREKGNGGHNKFMPRWEVIESPSFAPHLPEILKDAIIELFKYYEKPDLIPTLSKLSESVRQDGETRCNRSEAREADVLIMVSILFHTDLTTLRVATPKNGEYINRSCADLAKCISMFDPKANRPSRKFQRGFSRLQAAGILTSNVVAKANKAGEVRKRNSAKAISEEFLALVLGGDAKALERVRKARIKHSHATRAPRLARQEAPKPALSALAQKAAEVKTRRAQERLEREGVAAEAAAAAAELMSPEGKAKAYQRAKGQYQRDLINKGHVDFHEVHALMKAFPSIENWHP